MNLERQIIGNIWASVRNNVWCNCREELEKKVGNIVWDDTWHNVENNIWINGGSNVLGNVRRYVRNSEL